MKYGNRRAVFGSKEECYLYIQLNGHLNGWHSGKRNPYGRKQMAKRRKMGLTQAAQRKYYKNNKEAIKLYHMLMKLVPSLNRKGKRSFGRGVK